MGGGGGAEDVTCANALRHTILASFPDDFIYLFDLLLLLFDVGYYCVSFLNLLQYYFCFMFWYFGHEVYAILVPRPGIDPVPPALEGKVPLTGPPWKSPG